MDNGEDFLQNKIIDGLNVLRQNKPIRRSGTLCVVCRKCIFMARSLNKKDTKETNQRKTATGNTTDNDVCVC